MEYQGPFGTNLMNLYECKQYFFNPKKAISLSCGASKSGYNCRKQKHGQHGRTGHAQVVHNPKKRSAFYLDIRNW